MIQGVSLRTDEGSAGAGTLIVETICLGAHEGTHRKTRELERKNIKEIIHTEAVIAWP